MDRLLPVPVQPIANLRSGQMESFGATILVVRSPSDSCHDVGKSCRIGFAGPHSVFRARAAARRTKSRLPRSQVTRSTWRMARQPKGVRFKSIS